MSETAALINLTGPEGDYSAEYTAEQQDVSIDTTLEENEDYPRDNRDISWSFGPIQVRLQKSSSTSRASLADPASQQYEGVFDANSFEISVVETIAGISIGPIKGNLKDGVGLKLNLNSAKGQTKFYLKNGNEIWTHIDVRIRWNGSYEKDVKLFSI
ncbi:hypothetical protein KJ359_011854 [Pestalotiopsis sp. 9143b]|nr:hypothetical protein KJ359_011854 [Pestalotiopsis sp. 9143b]